MDSRADFMNWSIWPPAASTIPPTRSGWPTARWPELNQKHWALRVGYFLTGNEPNSNQFDMKLFTRGAYVTELETRYTVFSRPGKVSRGRLADTYFSGSYREAIDSHPDQCGPRSQRCHPPDPAGRNEIAATT